MFGLSQVQLIVAAIALAAVLGYIGYLKFANHLLENKVEAQTKEIGILAVNNAKLVSGIEVQNEKVEAWKQHGNALQSLLNTAMTSNQQIAINSQNKIGQLAVAKIPTDCPGAVKWFKDEYNSTARKWNSKAK